jgi:hypothetical protein
LISKEINTKYDRKKEKLNGRMHLSTNTYTVVLFSCTDIRRVPTTIVQNANLRTSIIMALQPFIGPWPLFQVLDPIHSR